MRIYSQEISRWWVGDCCKSNAVYQDPKSWFRNYYAGQGLRRLSNKNLVVVFPRTILISGKGDVGPQRPSHPKYHPTLPSMNTISPLKARRQAQQSLRFLECESWLRGISNRVQKLTLGVTQTIRFQVYSCLVPSARRFRPSWKIMWLAINDQPASCHSLAAKGKYSWHVRFTNSA